MKSHGTFSIELTREPLCVDSADLRVFRARGDKRFEGALTARSVVEMLGAGTAEEPHAAYVAIERIEGSVDGRTGSFAVLHYAAPEVFTLTILPGSGAGELAGITGTMGIAIVDGEHRYTIDYALPG